MKWIIAFAVGIGVIVNVLEWFFTFAVVAGIIGTVVFGLVLSTLAKLA